MVLVFQRKKKKFWQKLGIRLSINTADGKKGVSVFEEGKMSFKELSHPIRIGSFLLVLLNEL